MNKTYAIIQRYTCGIVQHTQTPYILEYEEAIDSEPPL